MLTSNGGAAVGFLCCAVMAGAALAQTTPPSPGSVRSRGVIILPGQATPTPSPPPVARPPVSSPAPNNAIDGSRPVPKTAAATAPVIKACDRPFAHPDLRLADLRLNDPAPFRAALAAALRPGRIVVVDLAAPYRSGAAPPDAIAPWLGEVRSSGGLVTTSAYCQQGRGAFGDLFARLLGVTKDPGRPYRAARRYDAVLHLDALDQVVTQIEFRPRSARPS